MLLEENVIDSTTTLNQRFMMLIQALSGIRGLTSIKIDSSTEQDLLQNALDVLNQNLDFERCSVFLLKNDEELHLAEAGSSTRRARLLCFCHPEYRQRITRNSATKRSHRRNHGLSMFRLPMPRANHRKRAINYALE